MTDLRAAAQQALEALERPNAGLVPHNGEWMSIQSIAIDALKAALAEPVQEPVAWLSTDCIGERYLCFSPPLDNDQVLPLYAATPQRKPLTEEEIDALDLPLSGTATVRDFVRIIERAHGIT